MNKERAFESLYRANYGYIYRYCYRRTGNVSDAEDISVEVFVLAWRRFDQIAGYMSPLAWLYSVAYRTIANHRRGRQRFQRLLDRKRNDAEASNTVGDHAEWIACDLDAKADAQRFMSTLDDMDKEILRLMAWEQLSAAEIAEVIGIKEGSVRSRLFRLRRSLRLNGEQEGPDCA